VPLFAFKPPDVFGEFSVVLAHFVVERHLVGFHFWNCISVKKKKFRLQCTCKLTDQWANFELTEIWVVSQHIALYQLLCCRGLILTSMATITWAIIYIHICHPSFIYFRCHAVSRSIILQPNFFVHFRFLLSIRPKCFYFQVCKRKKDHLEPYRVE